MSRSKERLVSQRDRQQPPPVTRPVRISRELHEHLCIMARAEHRGPGGQMESLIALAWERFAADHPEGAPVPGSGNGSPTVR